MNDKSVNIELLKERVEEFVEERDWIQYHKPKNLAMSISIEAAELMEIFQWSTVADSSKIADTDEFEHLKEELADVLIYSISLANRLDIDITQAILDKIEKNGLKYPVKERE